MTTAVEVQQKNGADMAEARQHAEAIRASAPVRGRMTRPTPESSPTSTPTQSPTAGGPVSPVGSRVPAIDTVTAPLAVCAVAALMFGALALGGGCANTTGPEQAATRQELIPADAVKRYDKIVKPFLDAREMIPAPWSITSI